MWRWRRLVLLLNPAFRIIVRARAQRCFFAAAMAAAAAAAAAAVVAGAAAAEATAAAAAAEAAAAAAVERGFHGNRAEVAALPELELELEASKVKD